jgi:hypothetical protein
MSSIRKHCLAATAGAAAFCGSPALAQVAPEDQDAAPPRRSVDYIDLTASLGYATNPFLRIGDSQSSAFGRASARGVHAWSGELSSSSLSAFVEASTYLNDYGVKSIFSLNGNTERQVSERVRLFGSAGVSGDLAGQLSNRFLYVAPLPEVPDPTEPPPVTVEDPDLFSFTGRQYRAFGQAGASIRTTERSNLSLSGGAQRILYTSDLLNDYTTVFGNGSYNHSLSERTTVGFNVSASRTEYDGSSDNSTIISPTATIRTRLSENWDASAGIGVSISDVDRNGGNGSATNLALNGSLCRTSETERLCGRVARYAQSSSRAVLVTTTSAGVDWFKRLDEAQTVQLSASIVRYISDEELDILDEELDDNFKTHHFRVAASYSRRIGQRLSAGADAGARTLRRDGPDPDADLTGSLFLRYRLGDLG